MLENYIDQIITMGTLADSVTIIDDQQIIRHFQPFNPDIVPFTASDVVGTHFRSTFLDVDPADSGVLRALHGESTISRAYTHLLFNGQRSSGIESIFPIRMGDSIIGSISVSRFLSSPNRFLDVKDDPSVSPDLAEIPDMIGNSPAMQTLKRQILRVARTDANVLICGETGTGKELVAHAVHTASPRCKRLFYPQNCAAIPSSLLESTFFGSEKGAYTGSVHSKGILEQADGGTVFLDEINSLDPAVQGKILRALETKKLRRLGGTREIQSDFRIVSAMNEDPFACMRSGKIRNDLFFRLSTVILEVPPLRQRRDDIPLLAEYFLKKFCPQGPGKTLSQDTAALLSGYHWPGNVRELENFMERLSILVDGDTVFPDDLPRKILDQVGDIAALPEPVEEAAPSASPAVPAVSRDVRTGAPTPAGTGAFVWPDLAVLSDQGLNLKDFLDAVEGRLIDEALGSAQGVKNQAAELLGIKRTTLIEKLKKRQA